MIGKGKRDKNVVDACVSFGSIYFGATGGAAALIAKKIKKSKVVAYEELGTEAVRELYVEEMPLIVINDCYGRDLYEEGVAKWEKK